MSDDEETCKSVFLSNFESLDSVVESSSQLAELLQQTGRNPSKKTLLKYWTRDTESINFDRFVEICKEFPCPTEDDILKAFRKLDKNGDGYLTVQELIPMLTQRGEPMDEADVREIIADVDQNGDGKLDYSEFVRMILRTTDDLRRLTKKRLGDDLPSKSRSRSEKVDVVTKNEPTEEAPSKERNQKRRASNETENKPSEEAAAAQNGHETGDSKPLTNGTGSEAGVGDSKKKTSRRLHKPVLKDYEVKLGTPANLDRWPQQLTLKGGFYFDDLNKLISHRYKLKVSESCSLWITIAPYVLKSTSETLLKTPVDCLLFLTRESATDANSLISLTEVRDPKGTYCLRLDLDPGDYLLLPYTTGARLPVPEEDRTEGECSVPLCRSVGKAKAGQEPQYELTKQARNYLREVFEVLDLDGDGYLSRQEFDAYNVITEGEAVPDDEWAVVEDTIDLVDGKIPADGFLQLNQMEVEDDGDSENIWLSLVSMGYDQELRLANGCPFIINLYSDVTDAVSFEFDSIGQLGTIESVVAESIRNKGKAFKVKENRDLRLHLYNTDFRTSIVVENSSDTDCRIKMDCSGSKNAASNRSSLRDYVSTCPAHSLTVTHHLLAGDESRPWSVYFKEHLVD